MQPIGSVQVQVQVQVLTDDELARVAGGPAIVNDIWKGRAGPQGIAIVVRL
jgi:hypothetical protein